MARWEDYHLPTSIEEALRLLARYEGRAQVIAGGTDLLLDLEQGEMPVPAALVDVTRIPDLRQLHCSDDEVILGAAVTHAEIAAAPFLRQRAACLAEACGVIGGPQVRHVATIGGNVAHALPAADGTIALLALRAEAQVATLSGEIVERHWRPLESLFLGPGRSAIDPTREILVAFRFRPTAPGEGSAFQRLMRPQGIALPILGVAVRVALAPEGDRYADVSIVLGPAGPIPFRAEDAERALIGQAPGNAAWSEAVQRAVQAARLRTSRYRASEAYRREMLPVLLRRALEMATRRARAERSRDVA